MSCPGASQEAMIMLNAYRLLKCAQHCDKHFTWIIPYTQASPIKYVCYHCFHFTDGKLCPERLSNVPLCTQLESRGGVKVSSRQPDSGALGQLLRGRLGIHSQESSVCTSSPYLGYLPFYTNLYGLYTVFIFSVYSLNVPDWFWMMATLCFKDPETKNVRGGLFQPQSPSSVQSGITGLLARK